MIQGKFRIVEIKDNKETKHPWTDNLVVFNANNGLAIVVNRLFGDMTHDLEIDALAIGTGDKAPTNADTALETEVLGDVEIARKTKQGISGILFEFFIADGELADNTYTEVGLKAGTQLFTRALFANPYVKTSGIDTRIEYQLTASNE